MQHRYAPAGISTGDAERLAELLQERLYSLVDLLLGVPFTSPETQAE